MTEAWLELHAYAETVEKLRDELARCEGDLAVAVHEATTARAQRDELLSAVTELNSVGWRDMWRSSRCGCIAGTQHLNRDHFMAGVTGDEPQ